MNTNVKIKLTWYQYSRSWLSDLCQSFTLQQIPKLSLYYGIIVINIKQKMLNYLLLLYVKMYCLQQIPFNRYWNESEIIFGLFTYNRFIDNVKIKVILLTQDRLHVNIQWFKFYFIMRKYIKWLICLSLCYFKAVIYYHFKRTGRSNHCYDFTWL